MLVYYYLPGGFSSINGKQIHGVALGRPASHVSHKEYLTYKDMLVQAPFTPEYIENKYSKKGFPYRAYFTLDMIRDIPYRDLQKIASFLEVDGLMPYTNLIYEIRNTLKDL